MQLGEWYYVLDEWRKKRGVNFLLGEKEKADGMISSLITLVLLDINLPAPK